MGALEVGTRVTLVRVHPLFNRRLRAMAGRDGVLVIPPDAGSVDGKWLVGFSDRLEDHFWIRPEYLSLCGCI